MNNYNNCVNNYNNCVKKYMTDYAPDSKKNTIQITYQSASYATYDNTYQNTDVNMPFDKTSEYLNKHILD